MASSELGIWSGLPIGIGLFGMTFRGFRESGLLMTDVKSLSAGTVHDLPKDLEGALKMEPRARATWEDITPLARNEWICWVESAKKSETRRKRIAWGCESLSEGKRRPCCWPGCPHR